MKKTKRNNGDLDKRLSRKFLATALGAEDTGIRIDPDKKPISYSTLKLFLAERLRSTGGRPRLRGTRKIRNKISLFDDDWKKLEKISQYYRNKEGIKVTSTQIASALIHAEVERIDVSKMK